MVTEDYIKGLSKIGVLLILAFQILIFNVAHAHHKQYKIALLVPRVDTFWPSVSNFMQAVCEDLEIECRTYYSGDNHHKMRAQIEIVATGPKKADAVIFHGLKKSGGSFIKTAEKVKINAFLINAGLEKEEYEVMGKPREKYKHWLGEMLPDDHKVGFDLANKLIDTAIAKGALADDGKVHMFGISGIVSDGASIKRTAGLKEAVGLRNDVVLHQIVPGKWDIDGARSKFLWLMKRYPQTTVVWAANDARALGALEAAKQLGLMPGEDIFIGGVDWSGSGLEKVREGEFVVDIGGHVMEAGWAVVMLFDYFHGIDFGSEGLQTKTKMTLVTESNINNFNAYFIDRAWGRVDFRKFSKHLNPDLKEYDFSMDAIVRQIPD